MFKTLRIFRLGILLYPWCFNANAMPDLIDTYQAALLNDPTIQQAHHTYLSARESWPQALSYLLPTTTASSNWSEIDYETQSGNPLLSGKVDTQYRQRDYSLSATQTLFKHI